MMSAGGWDVPDEPGYELQRGEMHELDAGPGLVLVAQDKIARTVSFETAI